MGACPLSQITAAMGTYMGSSYVNDFTFNNRSYRVSCAGPTSSSGGMRPDTAGSTMCVRSNAGQMKIAAG